MKSYYTQEKIASSLRNFFQKFLILSKPHLKIISYLITGIISAESIVTSDISRKSEDDFSFVHLESIERRCIGKQGIPIWFRCFKGKHNSSAYSLDGKITTSCHWDYPFGNLLFYSIFSVSTTFSNSFSVLI